MKKITLSAAILAAAFATSYADTKIAIVNPVEIFNDSNSGSVSVLALENEMKPAAKALKQEQETIVQKMQILQQNSSTMTKDELAKQQAEIQKEQQAFTVKAQQLQQKEYAKKDMLSKQFQSSFNNSVSAVAKKQGYNIVLTTQAVAYNKGVKDISNDVVALMNKKS
jgi:outer membrane protein